MERVYGAVAGRFVFLFGIRRGLLQTAAAICLFLGSSQPPPPRIFVPWGWRDPVGEGERLTPPITQGTGCVDPGQVWLLPGPEGLPGLVRVPEQSGPLWPQPASLTSPGRSPPNPITTTVLRCPPSLEGSSEGPVCCSPSSESAPSTRRGSDLGLS